MSRYSITYFLYDGFVVLHQSLLQSLPLLGGDAGVEGRQLPEGDHLVTHAGAGVLAGLAVGVDIVLHLASLLECHLGVEPPDHDLGGLQTLQGHNLQQWDGVVVVSLVHFSNYGQEVPHPLRLSA